MIFILIFFAARTGPFEANSGKADPCPWAATSWKCQEKNGPTVDGPITRSDRKINNDNKINDGCNLRHWSGNRRFPLIGVNNSLSMFFCVLTKCPRKFLAENTNLLFEFFYWSFTDLPNLSLAFFSCSLFLASFFHLFCQNLKCIP